MPLDGQMDGWKDRQTDMDKLKKSHTYYNITKTESTCIPLFSFFYTSKFKVSITKNFPFLPCMCLFHFTITSQSSLTLSLVLV